MNFLSAVNTVEFPNLFSGELKINRAAFSIVGLDIYWYGIIIAAAVILGFLYAMKRSKAFGMISDRVFDTAVAGIIGGFIGARSYYVIFHNLNPENHTKYSFITAITGIRDGGLAIYGGIIGAVVFAFIYISIRKINYLPVLDLAGLGFLLGIGIGRWGNFINQEAFGAPTAQSLPWGMTGNVIRMDIDVMLAGENALVHPCFLYESLWCLLGFGLLHFYSKKLRTFDGEMFLLFAAWYGTGRALNEGLRMDSLMLGSLRISQVLAAVSAVTALVLFAIFKRKVKQNSDYKKYCDTAESAAALEAYELKLKLMKEKAEAKKLLKKKEEEAPSILGEDDEDTEESEETKEAEEKNEAKDEVEEIDLKSAEETANKLKSEENK